MEVAHGVDECPGGPLGVQVALGGRRRGDHDGRGPGVGEQRRERPASDRSATTSTPGRRGARRPRRLAPGAPPPAAAWPRPPRTPTTTTGPCGPSVGGIPRLGATRPAQALRSGSGAELLFILTVKARSSTVDRPFPLVTTSRSPMDLLPSPASRAPPGSCSPPAPPSGSEPASAPPPSRHRATPPRPVSTSRSRAAPTASDLVRGGTAAEQKVSLVRRDRPRRPRARPRGARPRARPHRPPARGPHPAWTPTRASCSPSA